MDDNLFTNDEQKLRNRWLFWAIKLPVVLLTPFIMLFLWGVSTDFTLSKFLAISAVAVLIYLVFYGYYHCAYKKHGTIWLTMVLILTPIQIVNELLGLQHLVIEQSDKLDLWQFAGGLFPVFYSCFILYLSYQLRKVNKRVNHQIFTSQKEYVEALEVFQSATTLQELDEKFQQLNQAAPTGRAISYISAAYAVKKKMIKTS